MWGTQTRESRGTQRLLEAEGLKGALCPSLDLGAWGRGDHTRVGPPTRVVRGKPRRVRVCLVTLVSSGFTEWLDSQNNVLQWTTQHWLEMQRGRRGRANS